MAKDIAVKLAVEGENTFKSAIKAANAEIKALDAELKAAVSGFDDMASEEEKAASALGILDRQIEAQKSKLSVLTKQYDNASARLDELGDALERAKAEHGEESAEAAKAANAYNQQAAEVARLDKEMRNSQTAINQSTTKMRQLHAGVLDAGEAMEDTGEKTSVFGDMLRAHLTSDAIIGGVKAVGSVLKAVAEQAVDLTKEIVEAYGQYEQLTGGVETLFGQSADAVMGYAENAYRTAGMSANEYMETVTGFSASLIQSLSGDTERAAQVANLAIEDMSDNANKMGSDISSIQNAYQGFAKQNYTMLDNLKLGYGGTKTEMERLLADAERIKAAQGEVASYSIDSYADIVEAIHVVQTEMGITGTTAREAATTIEGSIKAAGAAWDNLLVGMADKNADIDKLAENFADALTTAGENVLPAAERAVSGIAKTVDRLAPLVAERLPGFVEDVLPALVSATINLASSLEENAVPIFEALGKGLYEGVKRGFEENGSENLDWMIPGVGLLRDAVEHLKEDFTGTADSAGVAADGFGEFAGGTFEAANAADELTEAMTEEDAAASAAGISLRELQDQITNAAHEGGDLRQRYEDLKKALEEYDGAVNEDTMALAQQQLAALNLAATNQELLGTYPGMVKAAENAGVSMEALSGWLNDNGVSAEEWGSRVTGATDGVINGFQALDTSLDMSLAEMSERLQSNIQAYHDWNQNIDTLMDAAIQSGDQSAVDFVNYMSEMGVGAAEQVAAMVQDVDGSLKQFAPLFESAADEGMLSVYNSITGESATVADATGSAAEDAKSAAGDVDFESVGYQMDMGMVAGIRSGASAVSTAAGAVAKAALQAAKDNLAIESPSKRFRDEVGKMITEGIAAGMVSWDVLRDLDDAAAELTGESVKDLKTMVKAWDDVYDSYYEGLKHQNFFLELSGDANGIIANYRRMQQTLHEQKAHYLALGVDANDSAIRKMEEQWWKYEQEITSTMAGAYADQISSLEHSLFLAEKNGKSATERIAILRKLQTEVHKEAQAYRKQGYAEDSKEIQALQKAWWGYADDITKINEETVADVEKTAEAIQSAYDEAFDDIAKRQSSMRDKLSDYGDLFIHNSSYTGPNSVVWLKDLDSQTKELEKYAKTLRELRERGASESLMEEILGLSVDDANAYGAQLLKLSDKQWDEYLGAWKRKEDTAASIAEEFFRPELDALNGSFSEDLADTVKEVFQGDELTDTVTDAMEKLGQAGAEAFRNGFDEGTAVDILLGRYQTAAGLVSARSAGADAVTRDDLYNAVAGAVNGLTPALDSGGAVVKTIVVQTALNGRVVSEEIIDDLRAVAAANPEVRDD